MSTLIEHLQSFNRKERFILLRNTLGRDTFQLDGSFRERLGQELGVTIPADPLVAMDYHLDWLQMALYLTEQPWTGRPPIENPNSELFEANQRDIDLLVAFDDKTTTHIVMLEAKVETGWTNRQLDRKADRLCRIFGDPCCTDFAKPHFVLLSPREPERIDPSAWPGWMTSSGKPRWMKLPRPEYLRKVTRCTADGRASATGRFLRIDS